MAAKKSAKKVPAKTADPAAAKPVKKAAAKKTAKKAAAKSATKPVKAEKPEKKSAPSPDSIARAAYLNYRRRVEEGLPGDSHGDWLYAERLLREDA
jgi:hypothetical protein